MAGQVPGRGGGEQDHQFLSPGLLDPEEQQGLNSLGQHRVVSIGQPGAGGKRERGGRGGEGGKKTE